MVCPSSYDLGEHARVVLMSVTEGDDKPLKYSTIFNTADAAVITKIDLDEAVGFNRIDALKNIHTIRPDPPVIEASSRSANGLATWLAWLDAVAQRGRPLQAADGA